MNTKKSLAISALSLVTALALLGASAPAFAASPPISGYWVITQAAVQSSGQAPTVVACGAFAISDIKSTQNTFTGVLSFTLQYPSSLPQGLRIPGINSQAAEAVSGTTMTVVPGGALFVSLTGSQPVALSASMTSPSSVPHPSIDPRTVGCEGFLSPQFMGLVHLPMQGTEGMTVYGTPFTSI